jgi:hypothetical protein
MTHEPEHLLAVVADGVGEADADAVAPSFVYVPVEVPLLEPQAETAKTVTAIAGIASRVRLVDRRMILSFRRFGGLLGQVVHGLLAPLVALSCRKRQATPAPPRTSVAQKPRQKMAELTPR